MQKVQVKRNINFPLTHYRNKDVGIDRVFSVEKRSGRTQFFSLEIKVGRLHRDGAL